MSLRESMPLLAKHEGVWEGYYRLYDASGQKIDEHKARLVCRIKDDRDYHQTNLYRWADGKKETREFPATIKDNRLIFTTDISGWAAAVDLDEYERTMMLNWTRNNDPDLYLYEMIQINDAGTSRARVWQWFKGGHLWRRTLIDEVRVSSDWQSFESLDPDYGDIRD